MPDIHPSFLLSDHYPEDTLYLTRVIPGWELWLNFGKRTLDEMCSGYASVTGTMHVTAHKASLSKPCLRLLELSGMMNKASLITVETKEDCLNAARKHSKKRASVFCQHVFLGEDTAAINWVTPPELISRLSNKKNLDGLTPEQHTPRRETIPVDKAHQELTRFTPPYYLKRQPRSAMAAGRL